MKRILKVVAAAVAGTLGACDTLLPALRLFARRSLGADASTSEDFVQETLLVVLRALREGRVHRDALPAFALATCRGRMLDALPTPAAFVLGGLEQHLFACPASAQRAAVHAELVDGLRRGLSRLPPVVVSDAQLARLEGALRVRCATIGAFEQRPERVAAAAQLFVTRVKVSLTGVDRLDVRLCDGEGVPFLELSDVPFEPQAQFVNLTCDSHIARRNPRFRVQLTDVKAGAQVGLADRMFQQEA